MEWNESFMVKDVMSLLSKVKRGKTEYVNSFQPDLLRRLTNVVLDCPERPEDFKFEINAPEHEYENICLTSGGADSTIAWYFAGKPQGLYIDIGQPYAKKECGALAAMDLHPWKYLDIRGTHLGEPVWKHIIPGRNFLFLTIAAEMVKDNGCVWFAMTAGEGAESDKGDKSLMFVSLFEDWYKACTGRNIYVQTMVGNTKAGWLKWFAERYDVNIIRKNTVTCFDAHMGQCGACQSCLRKYLSFVSNGMDISQDFNYHPMVGAKQYVEKYKVVLGAALAHQDYSHYSRQRCIEDLQAIDIAQHDPLGLVK